MPYAVIVEQGENSFGAYVPDLPGCVAIAESREEALKLIEEAIEFHLEGLKEEGQPLPEPISTIEYVGINANYHAFRDTTRRWRWNLVAANGQIVVTSSIAFRTKSECLEDIEVVKSLSLAPVRAA